MQDPYSESTKQIERVRLEIESDPEGYLPKTDPLTQSDLALLGTVVQLYGYADLNARRIIDTIRHAAFGPEKQNAGVLQDAQVFPKLVEAAELLPKSDARDELVRTANLVQMHVTLRHLFAHWATRRVRGHELFVAFTNNAHEAERRLGSRNEPGTLTFAVIPIEPIMAELGKIERDTNWLAMKAAELHVSINDLKSVFDQQRLDDKAKRYEAGKFKRGAKGPPSVGSD